MISTEQIRAAIQKAFPQNAIRALTDKGDWLKDEEMIAIQQGWRGSRVIDFTLDTGKRYCMKIHVESTWDDGYQGELQAIALLQEHNLPAPEVAFAETSSKTLGAPFYIAERLEGVKLLTLWLQVSEQEKCWIFSELGRFYKRMHAIHAPKSGLISPDDPYASRYPNVHPNDYMFEAELKNGSGKRALEAGYLSQRTYDAVIRTWEENMAYLKDHQPTLIHYSAFCWTISFLRPDGHWQVSKLTALGDVMWWDPALQLALMKYPPFMRIEEQHWQNFLQGYEHPVDNKRINLYALFTTICAAMGVYAEPAYVRNPYVRNELQEKVDRLLEKIHTGTYRT